MDQGRLERLLSSLHHTDSSAPVLQRICLVCADHPTIGGAGISWIRDGRHEVMASSDPQSRQVELLQVRFAEGPCVDVVASSRPCLEPDLASRRARERWPSFASAAAAHGVAAAFAFPLLADGVALGALDVYATQTGQLSAERHEDAMLLADLAALTTLHAAHPSSVDGVALTAEPVEPWAYPGVVHQASGMVAERLTIGTDEAFLRLRALAFATGRHVDDVATDVVDRRLRIEAWDSDV